jgi:hypothetical protein
LSTYQGERVPQGLLGAPVGDDAFLELHVQGFAGQEQAATWMPGQEELFGVVGELFGQGYAGLPRGDCPLLLGAQTILFRLQPARLGFVESLFGGAAGGHLVLNLSLVFAHQVHLVPDDRLCVPTPLLGPPTLKIAPVQLARGVAIAAYSDNGGRQQGQGAAGQQAAENRSLSAPSPQPLPIVELTRLNRLAGQPPIEIAAARLGGRRFVFRGRRTDRRGT